MTTITMITKEYDRTDSGKSWKSKPRTVEEKTITEEQLKMMTSDETCRWFRRLGGSETVQRTYTAIGYVPYKLASISPNRSIKRVREFNVTITKDTTK